MIVTAIILTVVVIAAIGGAALLARLLFNATGLSSVASMQRAIERGRIEHAIILRFEQQFGSGDHSISYFTGEYGPSAWNSRWMLANGRFELHIMFPVTINSDRAIASGSAHVILYEIDLVRSTGRAIHYTENQHELDVAVDDAAQISEAVARVKQLIK